MLPAKVILDILRNRSYLGEVPFRDLCHQPNESLVDSVLFDKAQAPLAERGERRGRRIAQAHPSQMLSGLVVCGHCHHSHVGVAAAGKGHRYRCYMCFSRRRYGKAACVGERLRADVLEDTVFGVLLNVCKDPERIERAVAAKTQERATSVRSQRDEILATETELKKTEAAINPTFRRSDEPFSANFAATASRSRRRGVALSAG